MKRYQVTQIERHRLGTDGKGVRTLVIMHGCPLRCKYCCNYPTWDGSMEPVWMDAGELYEAIKIDRLYMLATGGGITFGGGEPLLNYGLIKDFAALNIDNLSINLETSLHVPSKNLEEIAELIDTFCVDIKSVDANIYREYTGGNIETALNNLRLLLHLVGPEKVIVRIPIIPGLSGKEEQEKAKAFLESEYGVKRFDLFEYEVKMRGNI